MVRRLPAHHGTGLPAPVEQACRPWRRRLQAAAPRPGGTAAGTASAPHRKFGTAAGLAAPRSGAYDGQKSTKLDETPGLT